MLKKEGRESSFLSVNLFSQDHLLPVCSPLIPNVLVRLFPLPQTSLATN